MCIRDSYYNSYTSEKSINRSYLAIIFIKFSHIVLQQRIFKILCTIKGLLLSGALTTFVTGITEPLEYAFLFAAPVLYIIHIFLYATSFVLKMCIRDRLCAV